jgi:hypothetical protein
MFESGTGVAVSVPGVSFLVQTGFPVQLQIGRSATLAACTFAAAPPRMNDERGQVTVSKPTGGPAAGPDAEAFAEAHRRLLADDSIQFDLPFVEPAPMREPSGPGWLERLFSFVSSDHPVLNALLWAVIALAALMVIYLVARHLSGAGWPWQGAEAEETPDWRPDEAPARALLSEAEALAAQGRFGDAVHLLLFRSIEDIESRRPDLVKPALTSRDIAALPAIPDRPRGAFARIAMTVERSLFARRPLQESDWRDCRSAYEEFAFAGTWAG